MRLRIVRVLGRTLVVRGIPNHGNRGPGNWEFAVIRDATEQDVADSYRGLIEQWREESPCR